MIDDSHKFRSRVEKKSDRLHPEEKVKNHAERDQDLGSENIEKEDKESTVDYQEIKLELEKLKKQADQFKDQYYRAVADKANIERIMKREVDKAESFSVTSFAKDILSSCDSFEALLALIKKDYPLLHPDVEVVFEKLTGTLKSYGIEKIDALGEKINPNFHESLLEEVHHDKEPGTIVKVLQPGYMIKTRLLRPATVVTSKIE